MRAVIHADEHLARTTTSLAREPQVALRLKGLALLHGAWPSSQGT